MAKRITSGIVYEGPSRFDGAPIVAIVNCLNGRSRNGKTGRMAQLFIIRSDMSPLAAIAAGVDSSVCNLCKHRGIVGGGHGTCYVDVGKSVASVYRAYKRGSYQRMSGRDASDIARRYGVPIRLGAYGDPAALPVSVLYDLTVGVRSTGYTHSWTTSPEYKPFVMASVDNPDELAAAKGSGWRTFRTRLETETLNTREIACPASKEAGYRTTCANCTLCDGNGLPKSDVAIVVHGSGVKKYIAMRAI